MVKKIEMAMPEFVKLHLKKVELSTEGLKRFMANTMAEQQTRFFDKVLRQYITPFLLILNLFII